MQKFYKKPIFIIGIVVLIIVIYFLFGRSKKTTYETVVVQKGTVIQEVSVTGKVKPAENVDLAFEKSGKVAWVNVQVGDRVRPGNVLVTLANGDLAAQLDQAKASLEEQKAKLDELKKGTRPEEIQIQETKVENAKKDLIDKIQDAYTKSDDAIKNKIDQFFTNPKTNNPKINFAINDSQLKNELESLRTAIESVLTTWQLSLSFLTPASDFNSYAKTAEQNLSQVKNLADKMADAINSLFATSNLSQATLDTWKSDISTARTNINTAIINLSASESTLLNEENQLALDKAGNTPEQIANQEAKVEQAQANVKNYEAQLAKTILYSPISGIITKQDAKQGEIAAANTPIVSIISESQFQIETNVPEADIAKIKVGNSAKVTLDAYGNDVIFEARVVKIDPAETMIEGVATYKTTLQFTKEDERVKSGMTANIDILTDKRDNVLVIPQRAVTSRDGEKIVKILENGKPKEVNVKVGLRGSDGNIEILEGLNEGDKVITSVK